MSVNNWRNNYLRPHSIGMIELRDPKYCAECGGRTKMRSKADKERIICYECVIKAKAEITK